MSSDDAVFLAASGSGHDSSDEETHKARLIIRNYETDYIGIT